MKLDDFTLDQRAFIGGLLFEATMQEREKTTELREAAYDYAHLIHVENFPTIDMAAGRAYERLRKALGEPVGLRTKPRLATG